MSTEESTARTGVLLGGVIAGLAVSAGLAVALALAGGDPPGQLGPPLFVEDSNQSGVEQVYDGGFQYLVGGGAAVFDCNGDGLPDLYIAGGSEPASLFVNQSKTGGPLRFERKSGPATDMLSVTGAYPIDIDSDGAVDMAVLRAGENVILRGQGDCTFSRANELWNIDGGDDWTVAFSATWEAGEDMPTLAFGNYLSGTGADERSQCADHYMFRPAGSAYADPIRLTPGWCTLSILFSDWSGTGEPDLRMTNDRHYYRDGEEQLWRLEPGISPQTYTEEEGWQAMQIWGMGIASQDITGDGLPEVFLTSQGDNKLQTLANGPEHPRYVDIALGAGATAHRPFVGDTNRPSTAWHAEFGDVNNDGFIDLFVTKGNVDALPEFAMEDPNNLLMGSPEGVFTEAAPDAGIIDFQTSRGGALVDLNLDGLLDILVVERRQPVRLWRNTGTAAQQEVKWLAVDLNQSGPNRDAIGSWVEVRLPDRVLRHEVTIGGGHATGELGWIHLGLGAADAIDIRVIWPDGVVGPWQQVSSNQFVVVDRDGIVPWMGPD